MCSYSIKKHKCWYTYYTINIDGVIYFHVKKTTINTQICNSPYQRRQNAAVCQNKQIVFYKYDK